MSDRMRLGGTAAAFIVIVALAMVAMPAESLAQGCAMCATYLSAGDPRSEAFKTSILFLMAMPFTVVASVGGWIAWMYRRHRLRQPTTPIMRAEGEVLS